MKICPKCNRSLREGSFYSKGNGLGPYCKECFNHYCIERWRQRKIKAIEYLGGKCNSCQKSYHYSVFDFHHVKGKDATWTKMRLWSWDRVTAELDKCELLCANCHRLEHYAQ